MKPKGIINDLSGEPTLAGAGLFAGWNTSETDFDESGDGMGDELQTADKDDIAVKYRDEKFLRARKT